jgi:hypothetical protein
VLSTKTISFNVQCTQNLQIIADKVLLKLQAYLTIHGISILNLKLESKLKMFNVRIKAHKQNFHFKQREDSSAQFSKLQ